jgi:hypothetical protein
MRLWARILLTLIVAAGLGVSIWAYRNRQRLSHQWSAYQVGAAISFDQARREIARLEKGPDSESQIRELVAKWGTGNGQFDLFLARYVDHPDSSETMRKAFSLELSWREELLPRWAHFWSWEGGPEPEGRVALILEYLDVLLLAEPPRTITWREVLDLQAVFQLTGQSDLAVRLKPENWQQRYRRWLEVRAEPLPEVSRPDRPFPDWQGQVPR